MPVPNAIRNCLNCHKATGKTPSRKIYCDACTRLRLEESRKQARIRAKENRSSDKELAWPRVNKNPSKQWLVNYLQTHPCRCGETYPGLLDFIPRTPGRLTPDSIRIRGSALNHVIEAVKECDVVCVRCRAIQRLASGERHAYRVQMVPLPANMLAMLSGETGQAAEPPANAQPTAPVYRPPRPPVGKPFVNFTPAKIQSAENPPLAQEPAYFARGEAFSVSQGDTAAENNLPAAVKPEPPAKEAPKGSTFSLMDELFS